ncbi:MAG: T9SS type A sorting domain-containing protein [Saprospiraceae bacterium]
MIKILIQVLFFLVSNLAISQEFWTRVDKPSDLVVRDLIAKSDGTVYFSIQGSQYIYIYNILEKNRGYSKLPKVVQSYPIMNDDNLYLNLDFDSSLIAYYFRFGIYLYYGNSFMRPILKDTNEFPRVNDLANIKFDKIGNLFLNDGSSIYLRNEKWSSKGEAKIFEQAGYIVNFFPFTDSINYSIHNEDGIYNIYKYSATSGISRKLLSLPYRIDRNSLINEQGDMLLGVGQELYYYKKDGEQLLVPLIDSTGNTNGFLEGIFQSFSDKSLICYKNPNFFITYDSCKTWTKIQKFSKNVPSRGINKLFFWDTSHAVLLTKSSSCGNNELFEITNESDSWQRVLPEQSNYNFRGIKNFANEFIGEHDCLYMKSQNDGHDWNKMISPNSLVFSSAGDYIRNISQQSVGPIIFAFEKGQDTLFRSLDFGNTWKWNTAIKRINQVFHINSTELILKSEVGNIGNLKADLYYSNDQGNTWQLIGKNTEFSYQIKAIMYDPDGNLIMISQSSSAKIYKSTNKGISWIVDNRFDRFLVDNIVFEKDGRCIISGFDNINSTSGLFASYDFKNFINLSSKIGNFVVSKFRVLGAGKYLGFAHRIPHKNEEGIFITEDDGLNWRDISYNLPDFYSAEKYYDISDIVIDEQGFLYVSFTYDGMWRYDTKLVNTKYVEKNILCEVYPNPVLEKLMLRVPEAFQHSELHFVIFDLFGKVVFDRNFRGSAILDLSFLSRATYIIQVSSNNRLIYTNKILKY